jgi:hypothetical protein
MQDAKSLPFSAVMLPAKSVNNSSLARRKVQLAQAEEMAI